MGAFFSGCQSKLNKSNDDENKPRQVIKEDGTVWMVKPIPKSNNKKVVKKKPKRLKKMSQILLINGFARETINNHHLKLDIKIEQRILLFYDYNKLTEEEVSKYMDKMNRILVKNHDEGGIDVICKIINNFIWIGNDNDSQNVKRLKQLKITHVLNCAGLDIRNNYPHDIKQYVIDAEDEYEFDIINNYLDESFKFIDNCQCNDNGRILIHCMMGMNRSVTILISYLMYRQGMDLFKAVEWVAIRRGWILKNMAFRRQLILYANKIDRLSP